ncbi:hypothetical protein JCM8097_004429 [Rhodosporidiobolus ruineniae]
MAAPLHFSHLPRPAPRGEPRLPLTLFTDHPIQTPCQVPLPPFDPDPETRPTRKSWGTVKEWDFGAGEGWIYERGWQAIGRRLVHVHVRDLAVRSPVLYLQVDEEVQFKLAQDSDGRAIALETCGRGYRFLQCEIPFQTFDIIYVPPQIPFDAFLPPSPLLDHPLSFDSIRTLFDRDSPSSTIADAIEGVAAHGSSMRSELRFPFPRRRGGRFRGRGMGKTQSQQPGHGTWPPSSSSREPPQDLRPSSFPPLPSQTHPDDGAAFEEDGDAESSIFFELGPQETPFGSWASGERFKEDERAEDELVELGDEEQQPANSLGLDLGTSTRSSSCDPSAGGSSISSCYAGRASSSSFSSAMTFPTSSSSSSLVAVSSPSSTPPLGPRTRKASAAERMAAAHQGLPVPKRFERGESGEWVPCFDDDNDEEVKGEAERPVQQVEERAVELEAEESFPSLSPPGGGIRRQSLPAITAWGCPPAASGDAKDGGSVFVAFAQEEEVDEEQQQPTKTALPAAPAELPLPASPLLQSSTSSPAARMAQLHASSSSSSTMQPIKQEEEKDDSLDLADAFAFPAIASPTSSSTSLPPTSPSLAVPSWPKRPPPACRAQSTLKMPSSEPSPAVRDLSALLPALESPNSSSSSSAPPPLKLDDETSFPGLAGASSPPSRSSPLLRPSLPALTSTTGALILHSTASWSSRLQQQATTRPRPLGTAPTVQPRRQQLLITAPPPGWAPSLPGRALARSPVPPQPEDHKNEEEKDDLLNSPTSQVKPPPVVPDFEDETEQGFPSIPSGTKGKGKEAEKEHGGRETMNKSPPAVSKWPFAQQRKPLLSPSSSLSAASTSFKSPTTAVTSPPLPPASTSALPAVAPFTSSLWGSPPSTIKEEKKPVPVVSLRSPLPAPDSATSPKPAVAPSATPRLAPFTSSTTGISTSTSSTGAATSFSPPTLSGSWLSQSPAIRQSPLPPLPPLAVLPRAAQTPSSSTTATHGGDVEPKNQAKAETKQQDQPIPASSPPPVPSSSISTSSATRPLPTPPQLSGSWAAGSTALRQSLRSALRPSAGPLRGASSVPPSASTQRRAVGQQDVASEEEDAEDEEEEDSPPAVLSAPANSTSTSTTTSTPPVPLPTSPPLSGSWATRSTAILQAPQPAPPVLSPRPPSAALPVASAPVAPTAAATPSSSMAIATSSPPPSAAPAAILPSSPPLAAAWTAVSPTVRQSSASSNTAAGGSEVILFFRLDRRRRSCFLAGVDTDAGENAAAADGGG